MPIDDFSGVKTDRDDPGSNAVAVTPHDVNELARIPRALYVGTGGTIVMRLVGDTADTTWTNVPNGAILPVRPQFIRATGTTASAILGIR